MTNSHSADPSVADSPRPDDPTADAPPATPPAAPATAAPDPAAFGAAPSAPPTAGSPEASPGPTSEPTAPSLEPAPAVAPPPSPPAQPDAAARAEAAAPAAPSPSAPTEAPAAAAPPPSPPTEPAPPADIAPPPPLAPPPAPPEAPSDAAASAPEPASSPRARNWQAPVAALVVVAVVLGAFFLGRTSNGGTDVTSATSPTTAAGGFVTFNDPEAGFTIQYPKEWERVPTPKDEPLLAGSRLLASAGDGDYLHVQVLLANPATAKAAIEENLKHVNILAQEDITHNGLQGYSYLYTFKEESGQEVKHAHYFLMRGQKAYTVVFRTTPAAEFDQLAPTFLKVIESFQSTSDSIPAALTTPTTAAPTTAPGG